MIGLILKDLLNLRKQGKILLVIIFFYMLFSLASGDINAFMAPISIIFAMLPITALSFDERAKWDKYALTMPISRTNLVLSKYILVLIFLITAFIINIVFGMVTKAGSTEEIVLSSLAVLGISLAFLSAILPIIFKFGVEKGRLLMILVFLVPASVVMIVSKSGISMPSENFFEKFVYIVPFIVIGFITVSIMVSMRIYNKKEIQ